MTLLRGRGLGLEVALVDRDIDEALAELQERLDERKDFYRGTAATAAFGKRTPSPEQLGRLRTLLEGAGIALCALSGGSEVERVAADAGLTFVERLEPNGETVARRRALRRRPDAVLSESAKSLVADFAGARADIAQRRKRGERSVPPLVLSGVQPAPSAPSPATLPNAEALPQTLYHVGTLRGGQTLHNIGNVVVVGDVNPGAEIVASGDIVIFGRLGGVAHAGAQGDVGSRVYALSLRATQLRIATFIAADAGDPGVAGPEVAFVRGDRIVITAHDRANQVPEEKKS